MSPRSKSTQDCSTNPAQFSMNRFFQPKKSRKQRSRLRQARRRNVLETLESRQMLALAMEFVPDTGTVTTENNMTVLTVAPDTSISFGMTLTPDADFMMSAYQINLSASSTDLSFSAWQEDEDGADNIDFTDDDIFFAFVADNDIARDAQGNVLVSASNDRDRFFVDMVTGTPTLIATFSVMAPTDGGDYDMIAGPNSGFLATVILENAAATIVPITEFGNVRIRVQEPGQPAGVADTATVAEDTTDNSIPVLANDTDPEGDTLTITSVDNFSSGGSATINGAAVDYTPAANFAGTETFTYTMTDGNTTPVVVAVSVTVTNVNDDPITVPDNISLDEDSFHIFDADLETTSNDSDPDGDALTLTGLTGEANGVITDLGGGLFDYSPDENFFGTESLTYTVTDGNGGSATGTLTITVDAINDPPETVDDGLFTTAEDTAIVLTIADLLANDTDIDGGALSIFELANGVGGVVANNGDGTLTYTPNQDFNGTDDFFYTVTDGNGGTNTAAVTIEVTAVNDAPTAVDDSLAVDEDNDLTISVNDDLLSNDSDVDGDAFSLTANTDPGSGTLQDNGDGTFTYSPVANFNGTTTFTYTIEDGDQAGDTGTVTITVNSINDDPVAVLDHESTDEDTDVIIAASGLLSNDTDVDGDTLTIIAVGAATAGTVTDNLDDTYTYSPNSNVNGTDQFTYTISDGNGGTSQTTVTVNIAAVNDIPVANGDSLFVAEDNTLPISVADDVINNDSDADNDALQFSILVTTGQGTLTDNQDGTLSYEPNADFNGTDSFTYTVSDGNNGTATATATITVTPVNDSPTAVADTATTDEDTDVDITTASLIANDSDVDGDTVSFLSNTDPTNGTIADDGNGTLTYTPNADFNGTDSFTYTITDGNLGRATGVVTITINSVNDAPVAVDDAVQVDEDSSVQIVAADLASNDTDSDGGTLVFDSIVTQPVSGFLNDGGDGTFTYTPNIDFNGTDTFTYSVTDTQGDTDTATVTITVNPVNDAPVAANDPDFEINEDTALVLDTLLDNDTDIDGDTLRILQVDNGSNGTATLEIDGTVTYQPNQDYNGSDTFTYTVTDDNGGTSIATVFIEILPTNDPPVAIDDSPEVDENSTDNFLNLLLNDNTGPDGGENITIIAVSDPNNGGTVTVLGDGSAVTYTPVRRFFGTESFTYTISDGNGGTAEGNVFVTILDVPNDLPVAGDDNATFAEDTVNNVIDVLANDTDADGDTLSINSLGIPDSGGSVIAANNSTEVEYTPSADFAGTETFTYIVSDGNGGTESATVSVVVTEVNDAPVANDDNYAMSQGASLIIGAPTGSLSNDTDIEDNSLTAVLVDDVQHGSLTLNDDGSFDYTPNFFFWGTDSFTYKANDGDDSNTATVTLDVAVGTPWRNPVNPLDVNDDNAFEPLDILIIINRINSVGPIEGLPVPDVNDMPPPYIDPNGDNNMFPDDVLMLVNAFNRGQTEIQGEAIIDFVEPTSVADNGDSSDSGDEVIVSDYSSDGLFDQDLQRSRVVDAVFSGHARQDAEVDDLLDGFDLLDIL